MNLDGGEREALCAALSRLEEGDFRRYQDFLWLGFGDSWTSLENSLIRAGYVLRRGDNSGELTPKGRQFRASLGSPMARAAG